MARIDFVHYFDVPLIEYVRMVFEPEPEEVSDLTELPNLAEREELERREDDEIVVTRVRNFATGFIPPQVREHVKPHMLSWVDHSVYYKREHYWEWRVEPHYFKDIVRCEGRMSLFDDCGRTRRETRGVLEIAFPVLGRLAERVVLNNLEKNFQAEQELFRAALERARKRRQGRD